MTKPSPIMQELTRVKVERRELLALLSERLGPLPPDHHAIMTTLRERLPAATDTCGEVSV